MKSRILSLFLSLCLLLALLPQVVAPASAETASGICGENLTWTFDDSTGVLAISGTGPMEEWWSSDDIPWRQFRENVKTVTMTPGVTTIAFFAFGWCSNLTSVTIPDTVTYIGSCAFEGCSGLTSVTIPNHVTDIDFSAFEGCSGLTSVTIPDSVANIGGAAFSGCENLLNISVSKENGNYCNDEYGVVYNKDKTTLVAYPGGREGAYVIPNTVTEIGQSAFKGAAKLTSVVIPDSVTGIEYYAFEECTKLTSVTIPDSVTFIGDSAFAFCYSLDSITLPENIAHIGGHIVQSSAYEADEKNWRGDLLYIGNHLVGVSYGISGSCVIPEGTTTIADWAFFSAYNLTSVTIPDSVKNIGECAFQDCTGLTSVVFPQGITSISAQLFYGCTSLSSVSIPDSVTSIERFAFFGSGLTSITIPGKVKSIEENAFQNCTGLTSVTIPGSVVSIGYEAFYDCISLSSVNLHEGLTEIGMSTFEGCVSLESVTIPDTVTFIAYSAFRRCEGLTSIEIPENVESMGFYAFADCTKLDTITIAHTVRFNANAFYNTAYYNDETNWIDDVLYIGNYLIEARETISGDYIIRDGTLAMTTAAFANRTELTSVTIPESVECISQSAFDACTGLTSVAFGSNIHTIRRFAFYDCVGLTDVFYSGTEQEWNDIDIQQEGNEALYNATIHFNYVPQEQEPTENPFEDVKDSDYFAQPVLWAVEQGITNGTSAGKFSPERSCTRGQIVTFLWRAAGSPEPKSTDNPFTDISSTDYYYKAVLWAVEQEITTGTGKGKFSPDKPCTRGQVATFLWRAEGKPAPASSESPFSDIASGEYYYDAVLWAVEQGITNGTGKGKFSPDKDCTRGQIVTFLYRAMA